MEMNEILNGLNSYGANDGIAPQCPPQGIQGFNNNCGNNGGFGSWIWILLILFYSGGFGARNNRCCCRKERKHDCCCDDYGYGGYGTGNCSSYLFLLVILFLCNGCSGSGNIGNGNLFGGCC